MRDFYPANYKSICRDLDPHAPFWIGIGGIIGFCFYLLNIHPATPLHQLLYQRGIIQPISTLIGGIVMGFVILKALIIRRELRLTKANKLKLSPRELNFDVDKALLLAVNKNRSFQLDGILGRRWKTTMSLWDETRSPTKVAGRIDTDTEAFDLAQQNSYAFPRTLIWAIPILGFIGTVIGIGSAVAQFDTFLSNVDDIDALREGLANVTSGLGTAFDTTFLALSISLIVSLPLAVVERQEQRLLTQIDLYLRNSILSLIPDSLPVSSQALNKDELRVALNDALEQHIPKASDLVEPAKMIGEIVAKAAKDQLDPIISNTEKSAESLKDAHVLFSEQAYAFKASLLEGSYQIQAAIKSAHPLLGKLNKIHSSTFELESEMKELQSRAELSEALGSLNKILLAIDRTLKETAKPRRVVLVEQTAEHIT